MKERKKKETVGELQGQLILMGQSGLAYTPVWDKVAEKLSKLEKEGGKK